MRTQAIQREPTKPNFNRETHVGAATTKIDRYGWTTKDAPGRFEMIDKNILLVDRSYQREKLNDHKVLQMRSEWSWVACGTIIVARRDGAYWVIEGQHRTWAARGRADITKLPCLVFETDGPQEEARGFLNANTMRKPITTIDKFRALVTSGDEVAMQVNALFDELGISLASGGHRTGNTLKSVGLCLRLADEDYVAFSLTMQFMAALCKNHPIKERLLDALYYCHKHGLSLDNRRFTDRLLKIGPEQLLQGISRASAFYAKGGAKVWVEGILTEVNKGLRDRFKLDDLGADPSEASR